MRDAVVLHRDLRATVDARLTTGVPGYDARPVVGDFQPTRWSARLAGGRLETRWTRAVDEEGGDGTVPKVSAVPHEHLEGWRNVAFVGQKHASLQNDTAVVDHVGGVLRATPLSVVDVFPAADEAIAMEVEDALSTGYASNRRAGSAPRRCSGWSTVRRTWPVGAGTARRGSRRCG